MMKKSGSILLLLVALALGGNVMAQAQEHIVRMDGTTNGTTYDMDGAVITIHDDDSQGAGAPSNGGYQAGKDYTLTLKGGCSAPSRLLFRVEQLSVGCLDTVYIYEGAGTTGNLLVKFNSFTGNVHEGDIIFESPTNTSGMLTIRFRTDPLTDTNRTHLACYQSGGTNKGFSLVFTCAIPCEKVVPVIEDEFYRTRNGEIYDTAYIHLITRFDTNYYVEDDPTSGIDYIDTVEFMGANLCIGDGVIFKGHGDYTYNYGYYTPSDATSYFRWDMANEGDTITGMGQTEAEYNEYQRTGCFDIRLDIVDAFGCTNEVYTSIKVRTALNPIKTIFPLGEICNNDSLLVNMGYEGENATLTLKKIETEDAISKVYDVRTFVPDGCNCATPSYFEAPVEFTEFPNSRTVTSAKDICSICINMEHSFLGDIYISVVCPTGKEALLKMGSPSNCNPEAAPGQEPIPISDPSDAGSTGGGIFLGFPLDSSPWDTSPTCDSIGNPYGMGLDYCFSRDTHYTLITGDNAAGVWTAATPRPAGNFYIGKSVYASTTQSASFPAVPYPFIQQGQVPSNISGHSIKNPSNHEEKLDYYLPYSTFSELVGCPLNGLWRVRVYDTWGVDNGWIFNWSLDICNVMPDDCRYQVDIDSLVWMPDPSPEYHDYDLGHYRGAVVHANTSTVSHILSPDTAGAFPVLVKVYDEFGCVWDTATSITTYWSPTPDLGPDTMLCGDTRMLLNGSDRHAASENYSYIWAPFGQNTDTIWTKDEATDTINYIVQVTNSQTRKCVGRDTVTVAIGRQPMPNFVPDPFVFEGCAPFTLNFNNHTTDAVEHLWVFGDGITSTLASPTHTYDAGIYDLRYYATSADGCVDSIVSEQAIAVYNAPVAAFSWSPTYPSVTNPVATFVNLTSPKTPQTKYFWEFQYNIDNPLSVETLIDENPTFDFSQYMDGDPSGNYAVRLIARTDNPAPSGNTIYCRDTTENAILVVNDFLQFPNVVSPNGDGINDRFVIKNLVEGMGYPINQLDIYNKWGARVYHKENITHDEEFWDPKDMPAGTYFYRFSARGYNGNVEHNGAIEVVK